MFVDEIHRFNKSQQDGFLPYVEDGTIILVGATTENPSFELNAALLSRCQVFVLNRLDADAFEQLLQRAERETGRRLPVDEEARAFMKEIADGDGRYILNLCESVFAYAKEGETFDKDSILKIVRSRAPIYDKGRDGHYNLISAVHKSLRGSDVDAALYWAVRMIEAGEDPKYLLRRLTRFAVEDVSLADPNAVTQAIACWETYERLGSPEGDLAIMQLVAYLATAPKSVGVYKAMYKARELARKTGSLMPPKNILNAPTKLMKQLGYSEGYEYDPDCEDGFSGANYFPDGMNRVKIYFRLTAVLNARLKNGSNILTICAVRSKRPKRKRGRNERDCGSFCRRRRRVGAAAFSVFANRQPLGNYAGQCSWGDADRHGVRILPTGPTCVRKPRLLSLPGCWAVLRHFRLTCLILTCCLAVGGFMRRCFICWVRWQSELHFWLSE